MSADNWDRCPRCVQTDATDLAEREAAVAAAYGSVSVDEFDRMRDELGRRRAEHDDYASFRTFREDYEIYGAEEGVVTVVYSGACRVCELALKFRHEHRIDMGGAS